VKFLQEFHHMIVKLPTNLYHHLKNECNAFKRKYFKKNKEGVESFNASSVFKE
jgi:hypothetical protein